VLDGLGRPRPNYRPRPYPRRVAGVPVSFRFESAAPPRGCPRLVFVWAHRPGIGPTEIVVPDGIFPPGTRPRVEPGDAVCRWDPSRRLLTCDAPRPMAIRVVLEVP
jgi:endoglycosylceramidase